MIKFGTGGWRAVIGEDFTKANIRLVAAALARRMKREGVAEDGICVGYDRRFLSKEALIWFCEVLAGEGIRVFFVNMSCPTPQIMFTVKEKKLPYGAMVTASHNPAIWNGIKLFTFGGRDAAQDVTEAIQEEANSLNEADIRDMGFEEAKVTDAVTIIDPRDAYLDSILKQVNTDAIRKRRLRIVLDPMFGVSLSGLQTILYSCRCDIDVINDRHDAFFGRHLPAPNPDTLVDLQYAVKEHGADVGIATDGDADRLGIIDEKGRYVTANEILALLYNYLLEYKGWRGAAVRNIATTHLLDRIAAAYGQECIEVPVGFKHISAGMEAHDALIGGESSGGLTVRGHISGKDGLYAASLLVEMLRGIRLGADAGKQGTDRAADPDGETAAGSRAEGGKDQLHGRLQGLSGRRLGHRPLLRHGTQSTNLCRRKDRRGSQADRHADGRICRTGMERLRPAGRMESRWERIRAGS